MSSIGEIKSTIKKILSKDFGKVAPPSILIMGSPGRYKTGMTEELAKDLGAKYLVFLSSTMDPTDVAGCPQPIGNITRFLPPENLYSLTVESGNTWPAIACFDDLPAANDQVFASLFRLFQQREVGGFKLRNNVLIIATGNHASDKSAARELPLALANRCIRFDVDSVRYEEWLAWALENGVREEIYGFISAAPDKLDQFEKYSKGSTETAFPTPRSVTLASRILDAVGLEDPNLCLALAGACGNAWATAFIGYLKNHKLLIPAKEILSNPKEARLPKEIDVTFATISGLIYAVNNSRTFADTKAALVYAQRLPHKEHMTQLFRAIIVEIGAKYKDQAIVKVTADPEIRDAFIKNHEFLSITYQL